MKIFSEDDLFVIGHKLINTVVASLLEEKKMAHLENVTLGSNSFPERPTQAELHERLISFGAHPVSTKTDLSSLYTLPMGIDQHNIFQLGDVLFLMSDNWNNNPDGINREAIFVPIGRVDGQYTMPFIKLEEYRCKKSISSILQDVLNATHQTK